MRPTFTWAPRRIRSEAANIERERKLTEQRAAMELEIANLKSVGVQHAQEEYAIRQRMIAAEIAAEEAKASQDQAKLDQLAASRERTQLQGEYAGHGTGARCRGSAARSGQGRARGDGEQAVNLQNLDAYAQHFEKMRQLYGTRRKRRTRRSRSRAPTSNERAGSRGEQPCAHRRRRWSRRSARSAVAEQQRKLQEDANQYHQRIAQATEKLAGGTSNNTPAPYDGTNSESIRPTNVILPIGTA